jgi:hypothetical protein
MGLDLNYLSNMRFWYNVKPLEIGALGRLGIGSGIFGYEQQVTQYTISVFANVTETNGGAFA